MNILRPYLQPVMRGVGDIDTLRPPIPFDPLFLFGAGEQGAWYDPSDLDALFQDSDGLVPVTAANQPVGLMLDKSGRNHHAVQVDLGLRPILRDIGGLRYLEFNGIDSFMVTDAIDLTATPTLTVFAGITKESDAASAIVCETNGGGSRSFSLFAPSGSSPSFGFRIWGGLGVTVHAMGYAAPVTAVLTGYGDTRPGLSYLRVNGAPPAVSDPYPNGGGIGNHPMFIGMRNGAGNAFTSGLYGLIVRGSATSISLTAGAESYMAGKAGVILQ